MTKLESRARAAARERLFAAELAEVLDAPVAMVGAEEPPSRRKGWLAAALVLLGVAVASGVAWLRSHDVPREAQQPRGFDPLAPAFEQQPPFVHAVGEAALRELPLDTRALGLRLHDGSDLEHVGRLANLTHLAFQIEGEADAVLLPEDMRAVAALPQLEWLSLPQCSWTPELLRGLRAAPQLVSLFVPGPGVPRPTLAFDARLADALLEVPRLRNLGLSGMVLEPGAVRRLRGLPDLQFLTLGNAALDESVVEALASLDRLPALALGGDGDPRRVEPATMRMLGRMRLSLLMLNGVTSDDAAFAELPTSLVRLCLVSVKGVTDAGLQLVAKLPKLRALGLYHVEPGSRWSQTGEAELLSKLRLERFEYQGRFPSRELWQELRQQTALRVLWLQCPNAIVPLDLRPCGELASLEELVLCLPSALPTQALAPLAALPKLRRVTVSGSELLPAQQRDALRTFEVRPGVVVELR